MRPEHALRLCKGLQESAPAMYTQALALAGAAMRARPVYLKKQAPERRAEAIRRALARVAANGVAEEVLAVYFLDCRNALLVEWLDGIGVEHEEGILKDNEVPQPEADALRKAVETFRGAGDAEDGGDRELLLRAFAAQSSIQWPVLETLLGGDS